MGPKNNSETDPRSRCHGLPGGDRTPDPQLRRLMLYPTELRAALCDSALAVLQEGVNHTRILSESIGTSDLKINLIFMTKCMKLFNFVIFISYIVFNAFSKDLNHDQTNALIG